MNPALRKARVPRVESKKSEMQILYSVVLNGVRLAALLPSVILSNTERRRREVKWKLSCFAGV
jgi:hypothetical protein